jgi:outer membrane receptor protein involved in Fe transport
LVFPTVASPAFADTVIAQAQQTVTVSGRVRTSGNKPIPNADVTIEGNGLTQSTKADGSGAFSFHVPPGAYTITVNHGGYQSGTTDVAVAAGTPLTISVSLTESDLSNLRVIGRTSTSASRNTAQFNITSSATAEITQQQIQERDPQDLTQLLSELPGVSINNIGTGGSSTTVTPNKSIDIDGFDVETKVLIDGHPISSGVFGTFFTQFLDSGLIQQVDVAQGAGLNGATAGQSAIGTVNFRTFDFTPNDSGFVKGGFDSYNGSFYTAEADVNLLKDNRLSIIVGKSAHGYNGPTKGFYAPNYDYSDSPSSTSPTGVYLPQQDSGIINSIYDLSDTWTTQEQLAKIRYKFSDATALQFEFLGAQGKYNPQGGSYADVEGYVTVAPCTNGGAVPTNGAAGCNAGSTYNAPWAQNLIGTTQIGYNQYPGSNVSNNQPVFAAEFRTTFKDDTILFRPYIAVVNRLIDGSGEAEFPGNGATLGSNTYQAWYEVTNPANCTVAFTPANAKGASGPCFTSNAALGSVPYVVNPNVPHSFASQSTNVPNCSPTTPCYTTGTAVSNAGIYGYGTPFSQPELDRLNGYTFSYIHPFGANNISLQFDHNMDDTQKDEGDTSPLGGIYAGCTEVVGAGVNPAPGTLGYQSCVPSGTTLPETPVQIPETVVTQSDLSLDLQYALTSKLQMDFGNYYTLYRAFGQIENPNTIAEYALYGAANPTWAGSTSIAPLSLTQSNVEYSHYDPHLGFVFRPTRDISVRATAGSSISTPYASQLSGLTKITLASQGNPDGQNVITVPNPTLKPEEVVAFNLGADFRQANGAVFAADFFDDAVHNKWENFEALDPNPPANIPQAPNGTLISETQNVALQVGEGVNFSYTDEPRIGFGYKVQGSLLRSYFQELPALVPGTATTPYDGEQRSGVPYSHGYAEVQYAGVANSLIRFGAEYNGSNNSYYVPAFFLFDATLRTRVANRTYFQLSAQNLSNVNLNTFLANGIYAEGNSAIEQEVSSTGVYSYPSKTQDIYAVPFRTFRASLTYRL